MQVQIIFEGLQHLKTILKWFGLCANRDLQVKSFYLPSAGGEVVDDGVLMEIGVTVVLLGRMLEVDSPGKRMTLIERRGVAERRVLGCL